MRLPVTPLGRKKRPRARARQVRLALLLVLALLAGCSTPATPTPATGPVAPAGLVDLGAGGPEPVVKVSPEGVVYVAAQDPDGGGPRVWVSHDGGATFTLKRPTTQGGGEVDLAVGPQGSVYVTQLGTTGNVVSVSHDGGETWTTSALGAQSNYFDREWLGVDAKGGVFVVARPQGGSTASSASRSDDRGVTFLPVGNPWDAAHEPGLTNGNLVAWGDALAMPYVCRDNDAVCVTVSRDRGVTWTQSLVATRSATVNHVYPSLAASHGKLLVLWSDASDGRLGVYASVSGDGSAWSAPRRLSGAAESASFPAAADGWAIWLSTAANAREPDDAASESADWRPVALRLDADGAPRGAPAPLTTDAVHHGVISPPLGSRTHTDRTFGDFFTAALDARGTLLVVVEKDKGGPETTHDIVLRVG